MSDYPKSRITLRTLRVETELTEEDEGDPRGFDISLDDEAAGLILMNCLIHRDRNISFFVEQWPAIRSTIDLIAECAPTHDDVMSGRQLQQWALSLAASEPKASDGGLEMALGQAAAMVERMQGSIRRALYAWDTSTYSKGHDGRLWQCMEELRQEIGNGESGDAGK